MLSEGVMHLHLIPAVDFEEVLKDRNDVGKGDAQRLAFSVRCK